MEFSGEWIGCDACGRWCHKECTSATSDDAPYECSMDGKLCCSKRYADEREQIEVLEKEIVEFKKSTYMGFEPPLKLLRSLLILFTCRVTYISQMNLTQSDRLIPAFLLPWQR
jgi:hypothetical protein